MCLLYLSLIYIYLCIVVNNYVSKILKKIWWKNATTVKKLTTGITKNNFEPSSPKTKILGAHLHNTLTEER